VGTWVGVDLVLTIERLTSQEKYDVDQIIEAPGFDRYTVGKEA